MNKDTIYQLFRQDVYIEEDLQKNVIKSFSRSMNGDGTISGYDYSANPILGVYKQFYPNGNIMEKGGFCWFGFKMGQWFYFDQQGSITKTVDTDAGYDFNYRSLFNYCEKNNIPLYKATSGHRTSIYKKMVDGKKVWAIRYPRVDDFVYITILLDGSKGTLIKSEQAPFPREE